MAKRRPGRPSNADGPVVTRDAIVSVALAAVRAHGAPGLALREVARLLGVSLPSVQRHFPTRDDLWRACVDAAVEEIQSELALQAEVPPHRDVAGAVRAQVERAILRPAFTAAMASGPAAGDGGAGIGAATGGPAQYLVQKALPVVGRGRALVQEAVDAGAARPVDPSAVVALLGLGLGSLASARQALRELHGIDLDDPAQAGHFVDSLTDLLLRGLLPRS